MNPIGLIFFVVMVIGCMPFYLLPKTFRGGTFFGVTVDATFPSSEEANRVVRYYRRPLFLTSVLSLIAIGAIVTRSGANQPFAFTSFFVAHFAVAIGAFIAANKRTRPFARPQTGSRRASLEPRKRSLPGGWALLLGPMLIACACGCMVLSRRAELPLEAFRGAMSVVLAGVCVSGLFLWMAYLSIFRARQMPESRSRRYGHFTGLIVAYSFALLNAATALAAAKVIPLVSSGSVFAGVILLCCAGLLIAFSITLRTRPQLVGTEETPDECWKWGFIYYNPQDPAFLVEKRIGYGWTLNCGNKWTWVFSFAMLAGPFILRYFWFMNG
jgi:uncharacterized membrane protein